MRRVTIWKYSLSSSVYGVFSDEQMPPEYADNHALASKGGIKPDPVAVTAVQ